MALSNFSKAKVKDVAYWAHNFLWIIIIYGLCELLIWGISRALAPLSVEFFASSLGMIIVFAAMTLFFLCGNGLDTFYKVYIKSKVSSSYLNKRRQKHKLTFQQVDFINTHLGVAFPIPLVMLDHASMLDGRQIACVMANFGTYSSIFLAQENKD